MKLSILKIGNTGAYFTSLVFVSALIGAASAGAQTYRYGDSTTSIEQRGGNTESKSQLRRYRDGQTIITQDGNSTDITIQREDRFSPSETGEEEYLQDDDFYRRFIEERFSRFDPYEQGGADARDDFKQRMRSRMRSDFPD